MMQRLCFVSQTCLEETEQSVPVRFQRLKLSKDEERSAATRNVVLLRFDYSRLQYNKNRDAFLSTSFCRYLSTMAREEEIKRNDESET